LTDGAPGAAVIEMADKCCVPLLCSRHDTNQRPDFSDVDQSFDLLEARLPAQQLELEQDLSGLARSGAAPAMVLERLVQTTGKTALLQGPSALVEHLQLSAQQHIETGLVPQAIRESDPAVRRWMLQSADPTAAPVLYLELPNHGLVRLVSPVWIDGRGEAAVSLLARPTELTARDRSGLVAASRAIAVTSLENKVDPPLVFARRTYEAVAAIVLRAPGASLEAVAEAVRQRIDVARGALRLGREDVRVWLPYESVDHWNNLIDGWHAQLSNDISRLSIGHALRRRAGASSDAGYAVVQAAEAALVGERLFGPGHVTSYADAQLAKFLLSQHSPAELRSLYERAVGKLAVEDLTQHTDLVSTLEVYCDSFVMQRTGERMGVHRNTVLNRLNRIEEITSSDLEDGPTRLLFQLGLLAGRLLQGGTGAQQSISRAWTSRQPLKAAI
jgi:PucR C-terminal helix-turn-helix domain